MNDRHNYISTITGVREVALAGTADLVYWRRQLQEEDWPLPEQDGRASLLLTAIEAKFRGIPFRELSISVLLADGGAFLAQAFNSSRLLAFAERVFFQTPYQLAELPMSEQYPTQMAASHAGHTLFAASMGGRRTPEREEDVLFEGPIYLPDRGKVFYARLSGTAAIYAYDATDTATFEPRLDVKSLVFAQLSESGFAGKEWFIRSKAVHARSKTYER